MKKRLVLICGLTIFIGLTGCRNIDVDGKLDKIASVASAIEEKADDLQDGAATHTPVTIKASTDKHLWYIKDYVGKNVASFGYTSLGGDRMDNYGDGYLELILVTSDGSYVDIDDEEELKKYVVSEQNINPNAEQRYTFDVDENGEEYGFPLTKTYDEIVLLVKKIGEASDDSMALTEIQPSPDKYTEYIRDYVGRNLAFCGYESLGGDLRDQYGQTNIQLIVTSSDGTYIDISAEDELKKYVVTAQGIEPNTELKMQYLTDENGDEYSNLIDSQNIEEIELYVTKIEN